MKTKPLVSIIIVSYNTRDLTVKSIDHVNQSQGFKPGELEIIVVDNHSSDDTVSYLKKHYPQVKLIVNQENRGFGGANNQGVELAQGKYVLLLNTDAFLSSQALRFMVDQMEQNQDFLSVGPQLRYGDGRLQLSGGYLPTPIRVIFWMWWLDKLPLIRSLVKPYHVYSLKWHTQTQYPDWLMGACVLFRRSEYQAVKGFDEHIFMYAEEVELYRRLHQKYPQKRVLFTPEVQVTHLGGASSKKANAFRLVHELKGVEYIYQKHYSKLAPFIKLVLVSGALLRLLLFKFLPGRKDAYEEYKKFFTLTQKN